MAADVQSTVFENAAKKDLEISINYINDHGNCVKHGRSLITRNADDLMQHFQNLEEITIHMLKELKQKQ